jgi:UDP-glucuronate 4-epimerase
MMKSMHVLVTGGAGFIGSHLCEALLQRGDSATVVDNFDPFYDPAVKRRNLAVAMGYDGFRLVEGDIRDAALLAELFGNQPVDGVVHLAALAGVRNSLEQPLAFNDVNVGGTLKVLEAARYHGRPRFILASTSSVYGNSPHTPYREDAPLWHCISPYGASKIACERYGYIYHAVHGLDLVAFRFFTAYGERQRPDMAIHRFARAILDGESVTLYGDGHTSRDYTYIGDIVHGVLAALDLADPGFDVINLGNSEATELAELVRLIEEACGREARTEYLPEQPGDPPHTCADISHAREVLGFEPQTALSEGIARFTAWLEAEDAAAG